MLFFLLPTTTIKKGIEEVYKFSKKIVPRNVSLGACSEPLVSVGRLGNCLIRLMDNPALSRGVISEGNFLTHEIDEDCNELSCFKFRACCWDFHAKIKEFCRKLNFFFQFSANIRQHT